MGRLDATTTTTTTPCFPLRPLSILVILSLVLCTGCWGWGPIAHRTQMYLLSEQGGAGVTQADLAAATAPDALRSVVPGVHNITFVTCAALLAKARNASQQLGVFARMGMHLSQDRVGHRTAVPHRLPFHIDEFAADTEHLWKQSATVTVNDDTAFSRVAEAVHEYSAEPLCGSRGPIGAKELEQKLRSFEMLVRLDVFFAFFNTPFWRLEFFGGGCSVRPSRSCSMAAATRWREEVLAAHGYKPEDVPELSRRIVERTTGSIGTECLCKDASSTKAQMMLFSCTVSGTISLVVSCFIVMRYKRKKRSTINPIQIHSE